MQDVVATAILTAAAVLGCFRFMELIAGMKKLSTWDQVTTAVGVTAFLSALGLMLARSGIFAGILLLLLAWLVYDAARRWNLIDRLVGVTPWLSVALLFVYIAVSRQ